MAISRNSEFASLFKKYRLRSEIETLTELGDLLAEEGVVYENSLYTRWQKGQRTPRERNLLLKLLYIFAKRGGVKTLEEANTILAAANQRDLNSEETAVLQEHFKQIQVRSVPEKGDIFVGRQHMMKDIGWLLINKKKVLIHGVPGVGKTALAVQIGHLLKGSFGDGVFWFRADLKQFEAILDELLTGLGYDVSGVTNVELKKEKLRQLVKNRSVLIILDNVDHIQSLSPIFQELLSLPVAILYTSISNIIEKRIETVKIGYFSKEEYFSLAATILGGPFVEVNHEKLEKIANLLGYLPISCVIILKQICSNPKQLDDYLEKLEKRTLNLRDVEYDNKDLYSTLEVAFAKLSLEQQELLKISTIFDGTDFALELLSTFFDLSKRNLVTLMEKLVQLSLIERSVKSRFRIHPAVKIFLEHKTEVNKKYITNIAERYLQKVINLKNNNDKYFVYLDKEFENVIGIVLRLYKIQEYTLLTKLVNSIMMYIHSRGKWMFLHKINQLLRESFIKSNNLAGLAFYYIEDYGKICYFQNNFKEAEECVKSGLNIAKEINDEELIGLALQKSGIFFIETAEPTKAMETLKESISLLKKHNNDLEARRSYAYLGNAYKLANNFKMAEKCYKTANKHSDEVAAIALMFLGDTYVKIKKYKLAQITFEQSLILEERDKRKIGIALCLMGIAKACKHLGKRKIYLDLSRKATRMFLELEIHQTTRHMLYNLMSDS